MVALGAGSEKRIASCGGDEWVRRANLRDRGTTEFREVRVAIGERRPRVLKIRTLRAIEGGLARSLFCIMQPFPLRNINYVLVERRGAIEPFSIQLFLPYVAGTLTEIPSDRRKEGHLGSDFSYEDLKVWLYEEGHTYEEPEEIESELCLRGRCVQRCDLVGYRSNCFVLKLDPETAFVKGIDYFAGDNELARQFRAEGVTVIENVLTPTRMTITDRLRNHVTTIELLLAWYNKPVPSTVFEPAFRRRSYEYLSAL